MGHGLVQGLIGGEPVVHVKRGRIRDDIARHSPAHLHGVKPFSVIQSLHPVGSRRVVRQCGERISQVVDRVLPFPGPPGMRSQPGGPKVKTHCAVAAAFDGAVGGF